jgi:hypothetical protein
MREAAGEKKDFEIDSKSREMARRTLYRLTFAGGLLLGATGVSVVNAKSSETDSGPFSHTQLYEDGEMFHYDFLTEDICEIPYVEGEPVSGFLLEEKDSSILDWENLEDEGSLKTRMEEGIISEEKIEEVVEQKGIELIELEELLGSEVKEIFSLVPNLTLDQEGNLFFENDREELRPVLLLETERHLTYPYEPVQDVKFFVIHYDSAPLKLVSGDYRTVFNTLNGLNRKEKPSVHFCVDPYPITDDLTQEDGLGLILSQQPNEIPYKGRHVQIGINLETGAEDVDRVKTARLYEEVGIGSRFVNFVDSGEKDFNSYSLGVEQIGTNYSLNFPEQFPPNQQISNVLALSKAVASRYDLTVWDIVGHNEIQEKSDPGDEYMLTLRYLLGLSYAQDNSEFPEDFLGGDSPSEFLLKLRNYSIAKMGEGRYEVWNEIYGMDEVLEFFEAQEDVEVGHKGENEVNFYNEGPDEAISYAAILAATKEFEGKPYSWNAQHHHCSGYVAQYFKLLGFPIGLVTDPVSTYTPKKGDPMPNSTTVKQVPYLKMIAENYGRDLVSEITLKEMLTNKDIWKEIPAGTVLYLPERIGAHGYDTFTHTAIFMGLDSDQEPMFSEFSVYMKEGPEYGHGFEQFTRMYRGQNIEPYNSGNGELKVFMFDAVEASRRIKEAENY